jgi:phosphoserine phosphatase
MDRIREHAAMAPRVVCFDLDGTLTRGTTVSEHLAASLGQAAELRELERAYAAHEISNRVVADRTAGDYAGLELAAVRAELERLPMIAGIAETVGALRAAGAAVVLATVTWRFAAEAVAERFGFDAALGGTRIAATGGRVLGRVERHCDEYDKATAVEAWCAEHGVPLAGLAAVGDSRSDLPLFALAGRSIALNAAPAAREAADVALEADDLRAVLPLLD